MNRNSVIAFILILATVTLFTSPQYNKFLYEKILKKPYPEKVIQNKSKEQIGQDNKKDNTTINAESTLDTAKKSESSLDSLKNEKSYDTIWVENSKIKVGISEKGAEIVSIKMKDYKSSKNNEPVELIDTLDKSNGGGSVSIDGKDYSNEIFTLINGNEKNIKVKDGEKIKLQFKTGDEENGIIKEFEIGNDYKIGINISKNNLSGKRVKLDWNTGLVESENVNGKNKNQPEIRKAHFYNGETVQHLQMDKEETETSTGNMKWVGITSKYFMLAIVNDTLNDADIAVKGIINNENKKIKTDINYQISYEKTADENTAKFWIYAGPNQYQTLKQYGLQFEKVLFPVTSFWKNVLWANSWFPWVAELILNVLFWLYNIVKDYGVAILLLTLFSRIITYPLTHSSMKSMNNMREIQPKVESLRKRYKNNPQKLNQEVMALYKEEGVNPLNPGCLPIFLQMPIFIALFVVLKKAIELRGATTFLLPWVHDLSKPEVIFKLPTMIPMYGDNVAIMPIIMAVLTFFQNKATMKDPSQQSMIYIMPIFMLVLFNSFPSGLVLYWTFSSALAIVQQIITEKMKKNKKK